MSIRKKTLFVFYTILAIITGALVIFSQIVLLKKFDNVEQKLAESKLEQIRASIESEISNLASTVKDYAVWDESYQFTIDRNNKYLETNITQDNFNNLNLTYWIIITTNGEIIFSKKNNFGQLKDISPYIINGLKDKDLLDVGTKESRGIVLISGQAILIASHPITSSEDPNTPGGLMLIGRMLDDAYINKLIPSTPVPLKVLPFDNLIKDPTTSEWAKNISLESPNLVRYFDTNTIYGYALVKDIFKNPAVLVKTEITRSILKEGRNTINIFMGIIAVTIFLGALVFVWFNNRLIFLPLIKLQRVAADLSKGDFETTLDSEKKDEIGNVYRSFSELIKFLSDISHASKKISEGDLTITIEPQSEKDILSNSSKEMVQSLCEKIRIFSENSNLVQQASSSLTLNAKEASNSTSQITYTIQQVAHGISEQTTSVNKTASAVDQLSRAIDSVSSGAENQARAVERVATISKRIADTIRQVLKSIEEVAAESGKASENAKTGAAAVIETVKGMQIIKQATDISSEKIHQMGNRSDQIADIVDTIDDIASQTNLLALNAAIEAARAESQASQLVEVILNRQMISQAVLIDYIFSENNQRDVNFLSEMVKATHMDIISIANEEGINELSSDPKLVGFRYSDNPKEQSFVFRQLIGKKNGIVCQPPRKRNIDGKMYKYIGISRSDGKGFIQVGFNSDSLIAFQFQVGGFAVVASEVNRLAENARESAKRISALIKEINKSVSEAVQAMDQSAREVDNGTHLAAQSTAALESIISASQTVSQQAEIASKATQEMTNLTGDMLSSVTLVSEIVEENKAATLQMASNSNEVSEAVENFASVSEQNSAAVEEVSASTEEMKAQVELVSNAALELRQMAKTLQKTIQTFKLPE
jgi:methyl-accepting chemotaxis protein